MARIRRLPPLRAFPIAGFCAEVDIHYIGADVEWILAGSGSTSPGSARSRSQLHSAARRASSEDSLPEEPAVLSAPKSSR
jgi:hypothetical protein